VPVQIYCFLQRIAWKNYEAVQSDIMDHLISLFHKFDLQVVPEIHLGQTLENYRPE